MKRKKLDDLAHFMLLVGGLGFAFFGAWFGSLLLAMFCFFVFIAGAILIIKYKLYDDKHSQSFAKEKK